MYVSRHSQNTYKAYFQLPTIKTDTLQCPCKGSLHSCWRVGRCRIEARGVPDFWEDELRPHPAERCKTTYRGSSAAFKGCSLKAREIGPRLKDEREGKGRRRFAKQALFHLIFIETLQQTPRRAVGRARGCPGVRASSSSPRPPARRHPPPLTAVTSGSPAPCHFAAESPQARGRGIRCLRGNRPELVGTFPAVSAPVAAI